jgi:hypothetical protein
MYHIEVVSNLTDDREIVGDEDEANPPLCPQGCEEVEYLRLNRHIKRGDWLVTDEQARSLSRPPLIARRRLLPRPALAQCGQSREGVVRFVLVPDGEGGDVVR